MNNWYKFFIGVVIFFASLIVIHVVANMAYEQPGSPRPQVVQSVPSYEYRIPVAINATHVICTIERCYDTESFTRDGVIHLSAKGVDAKIGLIYYTRDGNDFLPFSNQLCDSDICFAEYANTLYVSVISESENTFLNPIVTGDVNERFAQPYYLDINDDGFFSWMYPVDIYGFESINTVERFPFDFRIVVIQSPEFMQ